MALTYEDMFQKQLHPDDRIFGVYPTILCVGCGSELKFEENPLPGVLIRRHVDSECAYSGRKFQFHVQPIVGTMLPE